MTATRAFAWDGLALSLPGAWEPARLGLGYAFFEDASGARLSLRWQVAGAAGCLKAVPRRLSRRWGLKAARPEGATAAVLDALPEEWGGQALAEESGTGLSVLFTLPLAGGDGPGGRLAVLAAPHARLGEEGSPCAEALRTMEAIPPGAFSLYDVSGRAPDGYRLRDFAVRLGHYRFTFASRGSAMEFHRFAPSEVILRGKSLEAWAGEAFPGRKGPFAPGYLDGFPCAGQEDCPGPGLPGRLRSLAARFLQGARFARRLAWKPDASRILAVSARHKGELSRENFEEVCRAYVVQAP